MGGVDVNVIVVDVDHPLPTALRTSSKKRWRATFGGQAGGNVDPLVYFILDTTK